MNFVLASLFAGIHFLQKTRVQIWLYGKSNMRIEGVILVGWVETSTLTQAKPQ